MSKLCLTQNVVGKTPKKSVLTTEMLQILILKKQKNRHTLNFCCFKTEPLQP